MAKKSNRVKTKTNTVPVLSWQQADLYLQRIGELQLEIQAAEIEANETINAAKEQLKKATDALNHSIKIYTDSLAVFATEHRDDFDGKQSRKMTFGVLGFRKSTKISTTKKTLELIKELLKPSQRSVCVRVKETVNKDGLATLNDEDLAAVKAKRVVTEPFFAEPDLEKAKEPVEKKAG